MLTAKTTGDIESECRAQSNLGAAYFTLANYSAAITSHRHQLLISMRMKNRQMAAHALGALGHIYAIVGDLPNALAMHKQCVLMLRQSKVSCVRDSRKERRRILFYMCRYTIDRLPRSSWS